MFACVDCHKDVKSLVHEKPPEKVSCAQCHADAQTAYAHSTHAKASKGGTAPAATCEDCHGDAHQIEGGGDPKSPVNHANIPATCGRCHGQIVSDGVERRKRAGLHLLPVERARPRHSQRIERCRGVHRLPRHARDSAGQRSQIADLEVFCRSNLRHLPHAMWPTPSTGAFTARRWRTAMRSPPHAPIATAFTPSRATPIPTRRWRSRMFRATFAPAAMRACGFRRSSAYPATA